MTRVIFSFFLGSLSLGISEDTLLPPSLRSLFTPPAEFAGDLGDFRSPLLFNDGSKVITPADWARRREEILKTWHGLMGEWPELITQPEIETL